MGITAELWALAEFLVKVTWFKKKLTFFYRNVIIFYGIGYIFIFPINSK